MATNPPPDETLELEAFAQRIALALDVLATEEQGLTGLKATRAATWISTRMTQRGASVSVRGVTNWLRGQAWPQVPTAAHLARVLRVNVAWLLYAEGEMRPSRQLEPGVEIAADSREWLHIYEDLSAVEKAMAKAALAAAMAAWEQFVPESPHAGTTQNRGKRAAGKAARAVVAHKK